MVLPALDDKKLAKDWRENDKKNLIGSLDRLNERERVLKVFEKVFEHVKTKDFKKLSTRFSIDRILDLIDRKCLRLIQQQSSTDRNRQRLTKILIAISISRETGSIDQNSGKNRFLKNKEILCRNSSKH